MTRGGGWSVLIGSARGAMHEAAGRPIEDAVRCWPAGAAPPGTLARAAVAVSDGIGSRECFRADRGARLAVYWACRLAGEVLESGALDTGAGSMTAADVAGLVAELTTQVLNRWCSDVRNDLIGFPPSAEERTGGRSSGGAFGGGAPELAYGATLLFAAATSRWLALAQLGDGETLVVRDDGSVGCPVPADPRSVAGSTSSLSQVDAAQAFRVAVVDLAVEPVVLVALATDGYGNAFADPAWQEQVGRDLAEQVRQDGVPAVRERLAGWLADAAAAGGDDASLALLTRL